MHRYKIVLEYDGTPFVGWQRQKEGLSVQGILEEAILRLIGTSFPTLQVAGRTDAGVHALGQVCHVDLPKNYPPFVLCNALNAHLRDLLPYTAISILNTQEVSNEFHARFSAQKRSYLYRIFNHRSPPALERNRVHHVPAHLDEESMQRGANFLLGTHDFSTFRAKECQANSPLKTLDKLEIQRQGDILNIWVESKSFLHHQVRNMVGTLILVGLKKWTPLDVQAALEARDRIKGGPTAPPYGLYLTKVTY
ncbi:MAG: tRNA pseudouridine(38-40) synthase TruA [Proteobacteria bacterium]|nr:tRNA pseudouridine(38-40) synthase TruA [Pseudomonadota bacterium]